MFYQGYFWFLAIIGCAVISAFASAKVHKAYAKNNVIMTSSGTTGGETASRLLHSNGVDDIKIGIVKGSLTDHYNPSKKEVNLSESTYSTASLSAVAVAAHEIGHVMQKKEGYFLYRIRTSLVPIVNFGSMMALPLVIIGLIIDLVATTVSSNVGFYIAIAGVILYGGSFLFALVTLPVELNASKRAKKMLVAEGIVSPSEIDAVSEVLRSAALTYLASLLSSLVYFLRFLLRVLAMFGRKNGRR